MSQMDKFTETSTDTKEGKGNMRSTAPISSRPDRSCLTVAYFLMMKSKQKSALPIGSPRIYYFYF